MNSTGRPEHEAEEARVERTYAGYARSSRRRAAWDPDNPGNQAMRAELLAAVLDEARAELASDGEVLDAGCGTGYWLEALAGSGVAPARLTGIDILRARVEAAAERVPAATVRQADARALPFEDRRFAVVLLFTVLSSLASAGDVRRTLLEARRVLAPGGVLLCYEPRFPNPLNPRVRRVRDRDFDQAGIAPRTTRRLTLLPPLARRLGPRTETMYPRLARVPALRSHRLVAFKQR